MKQITAIMVILGIIIAAAVAAEPALVRKVNPVYPPAAKQAGISGAVVVEAMIAPDGSVRDAHAVSGPPQLADAAVQAVSKWRYTPVIADGRAVAARTKATIKFELPDRVSIEDSVGGANSKRPANMVRPAYPPQAKANKITGVVRLSAVIGKNGAVQTVQVKSGDPLLVDAAVEAVRQWKYDPTMVDGQPVEVLVDIDVNFNLAK